MLNKFDNTADVTREVVSETDISKILEFNLLSLDEVFPNPNQPRKFFDNRLLEELAQSIRENGILQPILVRNFGNGYQIVSGERRFRASKLAGLKFIPAVIKQLNEEKTLLAGLIENIQRQDLNPIEEAITLREILLNHGLTHDQLAEKVGRSRSALTNRLRLLQLPKDIQKIVAEGKLSAGHAKMLAGMKDPLEIKTWVKRILKDQLSVYETEKQISNSKRNLSKALKRKDNGSMSTDLHVRAVEENLQEILGAKVRIRQGKVKGRIEIEFYDHDDLERVVESMVSMCL